jgi:hypothetical protein
MDGMTAPSRRTAATHRKREQRRREREGRVQLNIEADEYRLALALITSQRMTAEAALRRDLVAREVGTILSDWADRWLKGDVTA